MEKRPQHSHIKQFCDEFQLFGFLLYSLINNIHHQSDRDEYKLSIIASPEANMDAQDFITHTSNAMGLYNEGNDKSRLGFGKTIILASPHGWGNLLAGKHARNNCHKYDTNRYSNFLQNSTESSSILGALFGFSWSIIFTISFISIGLYKLVPN